MNSKLLTVIGVGTVALAMNANEASALEYKEGTVTASVLNVRSGPSTKNGKIGSVSKGTKLEILDSADGWYKVRLANKKEGWVSGDYLRVSDVVITTSNPNSNNATTNASTVKVTANSLNVRSGVGTSYSIIGKLSKNTVVDVLSSSKGWYKIKLSNGKEGWISGSYTQIVSSNTVVTPNTNVDAIPPVANTSASEKGIVTANSLNVRSGVGTSYSVVGKLTKGTVVNLLEESNGWYKVTLPTGVTGWCSGSYIEKVVVNESVDNVDGVCPPPTVNETTKTDAIIKQEAILSVAKAQLNKPYVYGAEGPNSFDCSGFTYYVYKNAIGVTLPRVSKDQAKFGEKIAVGDFQIGDLVYLDTSGALDGVVSHVGIYIGNGEMIHASGSSSNPRYVMITKIDSGWYKDRVLGGRRFI